MRALRGVFLFWLAITAWALLGGGAGCTSPPPPLHETFGIANFASPQVNPVVISADGQTVYVANTTSGTVSFLSASPFQVTRSVRVGMEPVSLALRPNGLELWVSNHVSDSVSVIDIDPASASFGQVIETIQTLDGAGATSFDEPVGIAFASNTKAYVALSSTNQVAIVNASTYQVTGTLHITAQEPRALTVRNGLLYVAAFESGNQSELSACLDPDFPNGTNVVGDQCSLGLNDLLAFVTNPNIPGQVKNILVDPDVPDRDVFVFDTSNDTLSRTVTGAGTLLYGLAVEADGTIWMTETDARNTVNGNDGLTLSGLGGRMFDNELARVSPGGTTATQFNLEPGGTTLANSLATPYGVALSADDTTLLLTSAGASRLSSFDVSGASPVQRATIDVGSIPKGLAFHSPSGAGGTAYVLNTLGNSVTQVTVGATGSLTPAGTVTVGTDPTPAAVRRGNIAFNNALASTTGNHSCGSCHPDGNTDQLLWRIGGACSAAIGCDPAEDEIRTTMPVRGLKSTVPLHWDGTLGDPFGGPNGSVGNGTNLAPTCTPGDADGDHDCFLNLVNASMTGVMCLQPCTGGNNTLTAQQKDDMATFLASVSYPPARKRRMSDMLSSTATGAATIQLSPNMPSTTARARQGMMDFFMDVGGVVAQPHTCADQDGGCHALPLGVSTNSATLNGFDAPTLRGLTDRLLQFSLGPTNAEEILVGANQGDVNGFTLPPAIQWIPNEGFEEATTFGAAFGVFMPVYGMGPLNLWQALEEMSTGHSGALGRQVTLNTSTAGLAATQNLLATLEGADDRAVVNLRGDARRNGEALEISYSAGTYTLPGSTLTRAQLLSEAQSGTTLATLTAHLRGNAGRTRQPLLSTAGSPPFGTGVIDDPPLPRITSTATDPAPFTVTGKDVSMNAGIYVDGQRQATASLTCSAGVTGGFCNEGGVSINLATRPANGAHTLQVQNPSGLLSNELPLCVANTAGGVSGCLTDS
jgi:YVTN family beta-propeller protein